MAELFVGLVNVDNYASSPCLDLGLKLRRTEFRSSAELRLSDELKLGVAERAVEASHEIDQFDLIVVTRDRDLYPRAFLWIDV